MVFCSIKCLRTKLHAGGDKDALCSTEDRDIQEQKQAIVAAALPFVISICLAWLCKAKAKLDAYGQGQLDRPSPYRPQSDTD
jgi:hypothetical protein